MPHELGSPSPPSGPPLPYAYEAEPVRQVTLWALPPRAPRTAWQRWGRNLLLFVLTVLSVFFVGGLREIDVPGAGSVLGLDTREGILLVLGLLGILTAHEMGHYLAARLYGVDATLPFFIPFPLPAEPRRHPRRLHPHPLAHPQPQGAVRHRGGRPAGRLRGVPARAAARLREARLVPRTRPQPGSCFGEPLLFQLDGRAAPRPVAPGHDRGHSGPLGLAAWFGLFVTALNLMPIGQLDGGHVTYALLGERARRISLIGSWVAVALVYFGPNWILWAVLLRLLGRRHPPTLDDEAPVGARPRLGRPAEPRRVRRLLRSRPDRVLVARGVGCGAGGIPDLGFLTGARGSPVRLCRVARPHITVSGSTSTATPGQRCGP